MRALARQGTNLYVGIVELCSSPPVFSHDVHAWLIFEFASHTDDPRLCCFVSALQTHFYAGA
jgi:hypothetical protein